VAPHVCCEKLAAGALLSQFYMGVENVLKRISKYRDVALPDSAHWHAELLDRFVEPSHASLPALFDEKRARDLKPYRAFRHVVRHGYGFDLDWTRMQDGVANVEDVFERFRECVDEYLEHLPS
jgi:hypothetical protein